MIIIDDDGMMHDTNNYVKRGRKNAFEIIEKEINYLLNCGMGKKKSLELLLKICKNEEKNKMSI